MKSISTPSSPQSCLCSVQIYGSFNVSHVNQMWQRSPSSNRTGRQRTTCVTRVGDQFGSQSKCGLSSPQGGASARVQRTFPSLCCLAANSAARPLPAQLQHPGLLFSSAFNKIRFREQFCPEYFELHIGNPSIALADSPHLRASWHLEGSKEEPMKGATGSAA